MYCVVISSAFCRMSNKDYEGKNGQIPVRVRNNACLLYR